jgi:hypothetical protein
MTKPNRPLKETYTEAEAAASLGITIASLHQILDQHIFLSGNPRPASIEFTYTDLLLLSFWSKSGTLPLSDRRILSMPRRK